MCTDTICNPARFDHPVRKNMSRGERIIRLELYAQMLAYEERDNVEGAILMAAKLGLPTSWGGYLEQPIG